MINIAAGIITVITAIITVWIGVVMVHLGRKSHSLLMGKRAKHAKGHSSHDSGPNNSSSSFCNGRLLEA